jgi:hypothetical protein
VEHADKPILGYFFLPNGLPALLVPGLTLFLKSRYILRLTKNLTDIDGCHGPLYLPEQDGISAIAEERNPVGIHIPEFRIRSFRRKALAEVLHDILDSILFSVK